MWKLPVIGRHPPLITSKSSSVLIGQKLEGRAKAATHPWVTTVGWGGIEMDIPCRHVARSPRHNASHNEDLIADGTDQVQTGMEH